LKLTSLDDKMAITREQCLDFIDDHYGYAWTHKLLAVADKNDAKNDYDWNRDHEAIGHLIDCCQELIWSVEDIVWKFSPYPSAGPVPYFLRYFTIDEAPAYDLTLDAILTIMLTATNPQIQYFIGLVDAYRQSLWNKPFNQEYFAALARGFAEWE
ncbi:unnamed protein product, partial [marine sediment metagenome]